MLRTLGKIIVSFVLFLVALIPVHIYFFMRFVLGPAGFWQELALLAAAFVVLIGPLVWLFIICLGVIAALWSGR